MISSVTPYTEKFANIQFYVYHIIKCVLLLFLFITLYEKTIQYSCGKE